MMVWAKKVFMIWECFVKINENFDLKDDAELEMRLERLEFLMDRRPLLLNRVLLRQNPHNVQEWLKRVKLCEGKPKEVK